MNGYTVDMLSCGENRSKKFNKMVEQRILDNSQPQNSNKIEVKLYDLTPDSIEKIASYLNTRAKLNMLYCNKRVYAKLVGCHFFWKHLCELEGLDGISSLSNKEVNSNDEDRLTWTGELLHNNKPTNEEDTKWKIIYQRGVQMRRNIVEGRYELWRLFNDMPVKKLSHETQFKDNNVNHYQSRGSQVRVDTYWNETFLVVLQYGIINPFHNISVWKWEECQQPEFLYSHNLLPIYPKSLFSTSFFLFKNFFVLMPDTGLNTSQKKFTSMLRVHDLNDRFKLVGKFDFDKDSKVRRHKSAQEDFCNELAHLHRLGDKAVALCRTPDLTFYIFSLPECKLEKSFRIRDLLQSPYEQLVMDQRFMMKDNTMMFMFHDIEFFNHLLIPNENPAVKYGRLLKVDFDAFIKHNGDIEMMEDQRFDVNLDFIEKICMNSKTQMTCLLSSGKIVVKDFSSSSTKDLLTIELPERMRETNDDEESESEDCSDGPSLDCGPGGNLIVTFRHFVSGRKVHSYDKQGDLLYEISLDDLMFELESRSCYLSVHIDGRLVF